MTVERARRVLRIEAQAITALAQRLGQEFEKALDLIVETPGKVIVTGLGKSGLVGRKIASTMASTGTPAFFLHPAEAMHGDAGMISKGDVAIALSKSGETEELIRLVPLFKRLAVPVIAMVGRPDSTLAKTAEVILDVSVEEEACPLQLAPTASTTASLALGDALAIALLERRGFAEDDFAMLHPAGALGRKLLLRVKDVMHTGKNIPRVAPSATWKEVVLEISSKMLGHAVVVEGDSMKGVVSDGDLRRAMEHDGDIFNKTAADLMTPDPKSIQPETLAARALELMERHSITALVVCDDDRSKRLAGILHLHDLLKAGVV